MGGQGHVCSEGGTATPSCFLVHLHSLRPTAANAPENGCAMTEAASARTPVVSPNVTKPHSQSGEREEEEEGERPIFCFLPGSKDDGGGDKIAEAKRGKERERSGNSPLHIRFPSLGSPEPRQTHFSNSDPFLGVVEGRPSSTRPSPGVFFPCVNWTDFKTTKLCKLSASATVPRIKLKAGKQVGLAFFLCRLSLSLLLISGCDQKAIIPPPAPADAALSERGREGGRLR